MSENSNSVPNFTQLPAEQKIHKLSSAILTRQARLRGLSVDSEAAAYLNAQISNLSIERDAVTLGETLGISAQSAHDMAMHQHGQRFDESDPTNVAPELTLIKNTNEHSA